MASKTAQRRSVKNIFSDPPLKIKKRNGVIMFDTKKKQGSSSRRFFRLPQALRAIDSIASPLLLLLPWLLEM
jgi:hypothetical protein